MIDNSTRCPKCAGISEHKGFDEYKCKVCGTSAMGCLRKRRDDESY